MKKVLLPSILLICTFWQVKATNYYIRTDGNDNNNGLTNSPTGAWKTINSALYGYCYYGNGPGGSGIPMLPGDTLQRRAVLSSDAVTTCCPSRLKAA